MDGLDVSAAVPDDCRNLLSQGLEIPKRLSSIYMGFWRGPSSPKWLVVNHLRLSRDGNRFSRLPFRQVSPSPVLSRAVLHNAAGPAGPEDLEETGFGCAVGLEIPGVAKDLASPSRWMFER